MSENPQSELRNRILQLVQEAQGQNNPSTWFDQVYEQAQGDTSQIPWSTFQGYPLVESWLNQSQITGEGKTALVIGCGLGDDAESLANYGFQVTAFDISPTAIAWCRQRFPDSPVNYQVADLLNLDEYWDKFDLVIESRTIQSIPLTFRPQTIQTIANLVKTQGTLLLITHLREGEDPPAGPPWPLSSGEIAQFEQLGFKKMQKIPFTTPDKPDLNQVFLAYSLIDCFE